MTEENFERYTLSNFLFDFVQIDKINKNERFCFILGAGASKSSGIKTGQELAVDWLQEIKEWFGNDTDFTGWKQVTDIDDTNVARSYTKIYDKRFKGTPTEGPNILNRYIDSATPSFGYSVLAQIISREPRAHNVIITTNFDNLTEQALYTFTNKRPVICGHEALADFAIANVDRPLIVKIHRDGLLNPISNSGGVETLKKSWQEALNRIFNDFIPVVIGYGGNDGSLMNFLLRINKCKNFYWCSMKGTPLSDEIKEVLNKHNGKLVEIDGFDELMFDLHSRLELPHIHTTIVDSANKRKQEYESQMQKILEKRKKSNEAETQKSVSDFQSKLSETDWLYWVDKANLETDYNKQIEILNKGLEVVTQKGYLYHQIGYINHYFVQKFDEVEEYYKKAIELESDAAFMYVNYIVFLVESKKDRDAAEKLIKIALKKFPTDSAVNAAKAYFLLRFDGSNEEVKKFMDLAINLNTDPVFSNTLASVYYLEREKNLTAASQNYAACLEADMFNTNTNLNMAGTLLAQGRKDEATTFLDNASHDLDANDAHFEYYFYRLAYYTENREHHFEQIKTLLKNNVHDDFILLQYNINYLTDTGSKLAPLMQLIFDISSGKKLPSEFDNIKLTDFQ